MFIHKQHNSLVKPVERKSILEQANILQWVVMGTKITMKYHIKNDIDEETGRISLQSTIAGEFAEEIYETKDKQLMGALVRLGWIPPDESAEVMTILNDLVRIGRDDTETNMFRDQFDLNAYKLLARKVLTIESPVINRYIIRE